MKKAITLVFHTKPIETRETHDYTERRLQMGGDEMSIGGIDPGVFPAPANAGTPAGGADSQIRALEQKLRQLTQEKGNKENAKKIEDEIQEVKRRIAALKRMESGKQEKSHSHVQPETPGIGKYLDESV